MGLLSLAGAGCTQDDDDGADAGPQCVHHTDCPDLKVCGGGRCLQPPPCTVSDDWIYCAAGLDEQSPGLGATAFCDLESVDGGGICQVACVEDTDCAAGRICTDFGRCRPATPPTGTPPGAGAAAALQAGFGAVELNIPVGVPLGGYGSRYDPRPSRYGGGLAASRGHYEGLDVRALVLDNGINPVLLVRAPLIFIDQSFQEEVALILEAETGQDWRNSLIISATHTHSGPARLWPLPPRTVLPLGVLGAGDHSRFFYDAVVRSVADAALAALNARVPAKLGWQIVESFDTDDQVGRDRRDQTPPWDDNRMLVIRVDGADGKPLTVLFSYGAHGTANELDYLTGDALAGAELGLEAWLGQQFGQHVPTMFINQNSGSMSPVDGADQGVPTMFERSGVVLAERARAAILDIQTRDNVVLKSRTIRFPFTYRSVGFAPGEWQNPFEPALPLGGDYRYGAIQCFGDYEPGADLAAFKPRDELACFGLHAFGFNQPPTPLTKSMITALSLDGLSVVTMPGELTMELSWLVLRRLQQDHGINPLSAFTWGYAQDHQLYLLPDVVDGPRPPFPGLTTPMAPGDYPPHAFSYLRGGYEASLSQFADKGGDFLVARASDAWRALEAPNDVPAGIPLRYTPPSEAPFPVDETPVARAGVVLQDMPATLKRLTPVEFVFVGGDPLMEAPLSPLVTVQKEQPAGGFTDVLTASRVPYTNRQVGFVTRLRKNAADWEWVVRWEEVQSFQAGTYRFHVVGHFKGPAGRTPYTVDSAAFVVEPLDTLVVTAAQAGRDLTGTLQYPAGVKFTDAPINGDEGRVTGSHRMRHVDLPVNIPAPLIPTRDVTAGGVAVQLRQGNTVASEFVAASLTTGTDTVAGRANVPVTRFTAAVPQNVASGTYDARITVTDVHGNTGTLTVPVTLP